MNGQRVKHAYILRQASRLRARLCRAAQHERVWWMFNGADVSRILFFSLILSLSKDGIHAIDPQGIAKEVTRMAQDKSPIDAFQYGSHTCAGLTAGEIIGWTLGLGVATAGLGAAVGAISDFRAAARAGELGEEGRVAESALAPGAKVVQTGEPEFETVSLGTGPTGSPALSREANALRDAFISADQGTGGVFFQDLVDSLAKDSNQGAQMTVLQASGVSPNRLVDVLTGYQDNILLAKLEASGNIDDVLARQGIATPQALLNKIAGSSGKVQSIAEVQDAKEVIKLLKEPKLNIHSYQIIGGTSSQEMGTSYKYVRREIIDQLRAEQEVSVPQKLAAAARSRLLAGAKIGASAGAAVGAATGSVVGLSLALAGHENPTDQCYRVVADAAQVVVDTSTYKDGRLGFLWIDNQTGQDLTVKLQWLGWTTTQDITVPARVPGDSKHYVWALGPAVLQYITIAQPGVSPVKLYKRGIVPINTVIGGMITRTTNNGAQLQVTNLRGLN